MVSGIKPRSVYVPVEQNNRDKKYHKKIYKEDLKIFVEKYINNRRFFNSFYDLPKEIYLLKLISDKQENLCINRTPIDDTEKKLFFMMINDNQKDRIERPRKTPRLRDVIIDRMLTFIGLKKEAEPGYLSFDDIL